MLWIQLDQIGKSKDVLIECSHFPVLDKANSCSISNGFEKNDWQKADLKYSYLLIEPMNNNNKKAVTVRPENPEFCQTASRNSRIRNQL